MDKAVLATGVSFLLAAAACCQPTFTHHLVAQDHAGAYSICSADMDRDTDMDLIGCAFGADEIAWWENNGHEDFTLHVVTNQCDQARTVYPVDMDRDGDIDILSAALMQGISWWENNGQQSFTERIVTDTFDRAHTAYPVDLDEDGDWDVLGSSWGADGYRWWENDGQQRFTEHAISPFYDRCSDICAADIDSDGDLDVLGAQCIYPSSGGVYWWTNDGDEVFTENFLNFAAAHWAVAEDLDRDGDMDLLAAACGNRVAWFENDGEQSFAQHTIVSGATFNCATSVCTGDLDNDDDMDVVACAEESDVITWWENNGAQSFIRHNILTRLDGATASWIADVNGDGWLDVLCAASGAGSWSWFENMGTSSGDERGLVSGGFALLGNRPNPFNSSTEIVYVLQKHCSVRLDVYNLLGEHIMTIHEGMRLPGTHHASWNSVNDRGESVCSGVYLCRLRAQDQVAISKILLIR